MQHAVTAERSGEHQCCDSTSRRIQSINEVLVLPLKNADACATVMKPVNGWPALSCSPRPRSCIEYLSDTLYNSIVSFSLIQAMSYDHQRPFRCAVVYHQLRETSGVFKRAFVDYKCALSSYILLPTRTPQIPPELNHKLQGRQKIRFQS